MNRFPLFLTTSLMGCLTCSCQSVTTEANAWTGRAAAGASLLAGAKPAPVALKKGMSKDDILGSLGKPSYQYAIKEKEVWVYENCNLFIDKAKETALNMVPVVGPAATLIKDLHPKTQSAKAEVTFDCKGKVIGFSHCDAR